MCICNFFGREKKQKRDAKQRQEYNMCRIIEHAAPFDDSPTNKRRFRKATKILLLGQPGSGKSTIVKKLRMRFGICISNYEKRQVRSEILSCMRNVLIDSVCQLENWDHLLASIGDIAFWAFWKTVSESTSHYGWWDDELLSAMRILYHEAVVLDIALQNTEPTSHLRMILLSHDRVLHPDWDPTDADAIQWYKPDKGVTGAWINDNIIALEASTMPSKREELNSIMPFVDAMVFVGDLSCCGKPSFTSPKKDQFDESLDLFVHILKDSGMRQKPVQLLLNKTDALQIPPPLPAPFGRLGSYIHQKSIDPIVRSFVKGLEEHGMFYVEYINALNAKWMQRTLQDWQGMVLLEKLLVAGII